MKYLALFLSCLSLAGCFGGGGGGAPAPNLPIQDASTIRAAIGGSPLNMSPEQLRSEGQRIIGASDRIVSTDVVTTGGQTLFSTACSGNLCRIGGTTYYISDLAVPDDIGSVMTHNGVGVWQGRQQTQLGDVQAQADELGGFTRHSAFAVVAESYSQGQEAVGPFAYAVAFGDSTGSVPSSGSATWRGVVTGGSLSRNEGFVGDATLRANFAASNIDAAFTNIHEAETGASRSSIRYSDIPFTRDGFARGSGRDMISGKFFGPGHAEAAGVFQRGSIIGAFGAKR
ncbi:MAG: hypothetical protein OXI01_14510 [Albidovulum sp.]|nr:hypothetical protein [Albidovulum sp.]